MFNLITSLRTHRSRLFRSFSLSPSFSISPYHNALFQSDQYEFQQHDFRRRPATRFVRLDDVDFLGFDRIYPSGRVWHLSQSPRPDDARQLQDPFHMACF